VHEQHAKAFSFVFIQVFMVHLMCPSYGAYISAATSREPFETLMNDDIMYQEISGTIAHYAQAYGLHPPYMIDGAQQDQQETGQGKNDKEPIILLKEARLFLMMIPMQVP
jgi:hypothetical protein